MADEYESREKELHALEQNLNLVRYLADPSKEDWLKLAELSSRLVDLKAGKKRRRHEIEEQVEEEGVKTMEKKKKKKKGKCVTGQKCTGSELERYYREHADRVMTVKEVLEVIAPKATIFTRGHMRAVAEYMVHAGCLERVVVRSGAGGWHGHAKRYRWRGIPPPPPTPYS